MDSILSKGRTYLDTYLSPDVILWALPVLVAVAIVLATLVAKAAFGNAKQTTNSNTSSKLFSSTTSVSSSSSSSSSSSRDARIVKELQRLPLRIMYATTSGTTRKYAEKLQRAIFALNISGFHFDVGSAPIDLATYNAEELTDEKGLTLFLMPTWTGGVGPASASFFFEHVRDLCTDFRVDKSALAKLSFAVFALGNREYGADWCRAGNELDESLTSLGAVRLLPLARGDESEDMETIFQEWMNLIIPVLCEVYAKECGVEGAASDEEDGGGGCGTGEGNGGCGSGNSSSKKGKSLRQVRSWEEQESLQRRIVSASTTMITKKSTAKSGKANSTKPGAAANACGSGCACSSEKGSQQQQGGGGCCNDNDDNTGNSSSGGCCSNNNNNDDEYEEEQQPLGPRGRMKADGTGDGTFGDPNKVWLSIKEHRRKNRKAREEAEIEAERQDALAKRRAELEAAAARLRKLPSASSATTTARNNEENGDDLAQEDGDEEEDVEYTEEDAINDRILAEPDVGAEGSRSSRSRSSRSSVAADPSVVTAAAFVDSDDEGEEADGSIKGARIQGIMGVGYEQGAMVGAGGGASDGVVDMEDMGSLMRQASEERSREEDAAARGVHEIREMVTPAQRRALTKEGYKIIGSHSAVKLCRWTKAQLRGRGGCYKHTFYGITSYQCMEATPSLACANKCKHCWRHFKNPVGREWRWKTDAPEDIVREAIRMHVQMIHVFKGAPGVRPERLAEAYTVRHCALSLVGEPIMYPRVNELIRLLHTRKISTFLVTNAQFPDEIIQLEPVTQLYVSIDAATRDTLRAIDRPLFTDFWERYLASLDALRQKKQRTVFRMTLIKGANMEDDHLQSYIELIDRGYPELIEIKGVTYCGTSNGSDLTMANVPWHTEVRRYCELLCEKTGGRYELAAEHEHSCCVLLAQTKFKIEGVWHTHINYDKFHALAARYYETNGAETFTSLDYAAPTPSWARYGSVEAGFDPIEMRWRRTKDGGVTAVEYKSSESGCG